MKRTQRILSLLLAVLVMLGSISLLSSVNIFAAGTISYSFTSTKAGYAQGTVTVKGDNGTYWVYWSDNTKALAGYDEVAKLTVSGGQGVFTMPKYTAIPADATKLIAFASSSEPSASNRTVAKASAVFSIPASKQLSFKSSDAFYTFGAISDVQLDNQSTSRYPYDDSHFVKALETLAKRGVDFTVSSGDTVNDQNGNVSYAAEYKEYQRMLADSSYTAPIYECLGNHDVGTKWDKNGNYYNNNAPFIKATGLDSKKSTINAGKPYFEVTEPKTGDHFIFMALEGGFYTNKGTQFSKAQLDWLEGLLKKYSTDGKNIFIIEHANVEGWGSGDKPTAPYYYDLGLVKTNPDVARFIKLMETYKDCVIITGHTHLELSAQYNYSDNNGTSAVMMHNSAIGGVRYINDSGNVQREPAISGLSEGYIVEVYEDCILFNGTNMYRNEIMPQCSYIVPMGTSADEDYTAPDDPDPVVTTPQKPEDDKITITIKDETGSGWMKNNATEREIQLIDNDTNTKYIMTSSDGYKTWKVEVPRTVTDITFRRVNVTNNELRNQWDAGERNGSVQYCVLDDAGGGTTKGNGYWDTSVTEPPKPVVTDPKETATTPKPVVTEPKETTTTPKPVVTEPKETTTTPKPVVTEPKETTTTPKPVVTEPKETTTAPKPVVTEPVVIPTIPAPTKPQTTTAVVTEPSESAVATTPQGTVSTDPVKPTDSTDNGTTPASTASTVSTIPATSTVPDENVSELVVIVEDMGDCNILVRTYHADDTKIGEYQFAINGVVYQEYSDKSYFMCNVPYDGEYKVEVSAKYMDGSFCEGFVVFEVKDKVAYLPEMPEIPEKPTETTEPVEPTQSGTTPSEGETSASQSASAEITATVTVTVTASADVTETTTGVAEYMYGDADLNGKINVKDATTIQKFAAKMLTLDEVAEIQADVTGDMKVNVKDATSIQKFIAKLILVFPVEEAALVSVGASTTAKDDLNAYYTYSSYNQYMELKKAYMSGASQSVITAKQNALYDIAGASPSEIGKDITIYFTNTNGWSNVYAHIWGSAGDKATWPGTKMTFVRNNSSGKGIYKISFSFDDYQKIIFTNNSGEQTVDITLTGESGIGYYLSGGSGKAFTVTSYKYSE